MPVVMKYKTVLFDLDDTIYDHQYSRRCALKKITQIYSLGSIPIKELERVHQYYLDLEYNKVLSGELDIDQCWE